ncbi:hypothetical protein RIF29_09443 [Crotalaria pallida]|uniref:Polygalacturonase At3g15720 n=1 Tax=Crotalaria pallida TaxID=3830 RepID=A0AAN9FRX0_CROPI
MKCLFVIFSVFVVASPCLCASISRNKGLIFNVLDYGATGNGQNDDSHAFMTAWRDVCDTIKGTPTLVVPQRKTFMLQPVWFHGPCKPPSINVKLQGTIVAPNSVEAWKWPNNYKDAWIHFSDISGLVITGGGSGIINGQGAAWWNSTSNRNVNKPTALHIHGCTNLKLVGLTHVNSPKNHIGINSCNGSLISGLRISAPADSPNTDGIDISETSYMTIQNSIIKTGDDCIAINGGSSFVNISRIVCGPGHGISIGSLGRNGAYDTVEEIHVQNCTFVGTSNGARIKTWKGGSGYARKITFEDIRVENAQNPIIIDQQYDVLYYGEKVVKVSDVTFRNVVGIASCEDVIQLNCDQIVGCTNIVLEGINITAPPNIGKTYASCKNAHGICDMCNPNVPCLS